MDSTPIDPRLIILRSPFNGETIEVTPDICPPAMFDAMIRAGFIQVNAPKSKTSQKETR